VERLPRFAACWKEQPVQHFITSYGYLAVFLLMLAESACIPIPSEFIMLLGGALAAGAVAGAHPSLALIVVAGVAGNVAGSYLAWAVGRYAGQAAVRRWGARVGIRDHEIDRATRWFEKYGLVAVLVGRVIPVVRTFISLPAGFADMPAVRFGVYTTLGCIPWTAALGIAGYAVGANWQHVANDFHGPTYAIAGVIVVALAAAVVLYFRRRRRAGAEASYPAASRAAHEGHAHEGPTRGGPTRGGRTPDGRTPDGRTPDGRTPDGRRRDGYGYGAQPPAAYAPGAEPPAQQWPPQGEGRFR
jgi:membrane protein DedA with SNARE-associated domain